MRFSTGWMLLAVMAAGFAGGRFSKATAPVTVRTEPDSRTMRTSSSSRNGSLPISSVTAISAGTPAEMIPEKVVSPLEMVRALSDEEFGKELLKLWFASPSPENLLKKALFASLCDGPKALVFYEEFKKNQGMPVASEGGQDLRAFMTMIGRTHGREFMEHLLAVIPNGTSDLDSLMHGWVDSKPGEAVAWINGLPEGSPVFSQAAKGMIWALAATSPASAMDVFVTLAPSERDEKMYHLMSSSAVQNHGIKGLNELVALAPSDEEKHRVMMAGMEYSNYQSPASFVDGMAGNLDKYPEIESQFSWMAGRWVSQMPEDAISWIGENAAKPASPQALTILTRHLAEAGYKDRIEAWLGDNAQAPGRTAVEVGLKTGGGQ